MSFFIEMEKLILKFMWKYNRPWLAKTFLSKKRLKVSKYQTSNYYRTIVSKPAWYWHKTRRKVKWRRIEDSEINLPSNCNLIWFLKKCPKVYIGEMTVFSIVLSEKKTGYQCAED
jgi:hypothetical protein